MDTITISNSKLKSFTRCQRQYYYKYVLNLQTKRKKEVLEKGSLVHSCLEAYYVERDRSAIVPVIKAYQKKLSKMFDEEAALYKEIPLEVATILRGYHRHWNDLKRFKIAKIGKERVIEKAIIVPLTKHVELGCTLDLAVIDKMGEWVMDHKTARNLPSDDFRATDTQSVLYEFAYEQETGRKVEGIIWNYIRTKAPTVPQLLKKGEMSRNSRIDTDQYTYRKALEAMGLDPKDYEDFISTLPTSKMFYHRIRCPRNQRMINEVVKTTALVGERVYNLQGKKPDNYVRSLNFMCDKGCEFRQLCMADMQGHDIQFMLDHHFEPRKEDKYGHKAEEEASS